MFKKLIDGELSLKDTFWKFGVLGMLAVHLVVKILGTMLARADHSRLLHHPQVRAGNVDGDPHHFIFQFALFPAVLCRFDGDRHLAEFRRI